MSESETGRPETIEAKVYRELRRSIMQGVFNPGEKLSLRGLASALGTSVMPVRAALSRLTAERACEQGDNRSFSIPSMTPEKLEEVTFWRCELEGHAALITAEVITATEVETLERLTDAMHACYESSDWAGVLNNNFDFHFTIYRAAPSVILLPMIEALWLQMGPFTHFSLPSPRFVWNSQHHNDLINAFKARDGQAAQSAVRNDIVSLSQFLGKVGFAQPPSLRAIS